MNEQTATWVTIAGGALMLFSLFLGWTTADSPILSDSGDNPIGHYFFTGGIAWILVVVVGVIAVLRLTEQLGDDRNWSMILALLAVIAALLMLIRIILGARTPDELQQLVDDGIITVRIGTGMWVGLVAAVVAAAGAVMGYLAAGGKVSDLADVDEITGAFDDDPEA